LKPEVDTSESGLLELAVEGYRSSCNMTGGALRTASQLVKDAISAVEVDDNKSFPMLSKVRLGKKARLRVEVLKQYVYYATIYSSRVKLSEFRGYEVVKSIFEALAGENGFMLMPPEFRREVQHSSALSLLDFPFPGAAFASRNAAEGGGEGRKIRSFLGEPERPKVLHFASESTM